MADPRKTQVRALRRLAAHCNDVQPVRDDSGKERVEQFAKQLSKSKFLSAPQKQEVATALEAYLATFSGPPAGQEVVSSTGFRLRGRSFLLTYNGLSRQTLPGRNALCRNTCAALAHLAGVETAEEGGAGS